MGDKDWELVNAYHDGEMRPQDARDFEARLREEPELKAELERVKTVARSLAALRPQTMAAQAKPKTRFSKWLGVSAVAASVCLAVLLSWPERANGVYAIHQSFLDQSVSINSEALYPVAAQSAFPDLGAANLTYVASRKTDIGTAIHYAGRNGCRLTFLAMTEPAPGPFQSDLQILQWEIDERHFAILASGMDAGKFSAIGKYLKHETRKAIEEETTIALREATENAKTCA
ncbi:MAG: hypothetical protein AAGE80_07520 [Pseudomonadota bacterium]